MSCDWMFHTFYHQLRSAGVIGLFYQSNQLVEHPHAAKLTPAHGAQIVHPPTYCFYAHMHEIMKLNRSKSACRIHWVSRLLGCLDAWCGGAAKGSGITALYGVMECATQTPLVGALSAGLLGASTAGRVVRSHTRSQEVTEWHRSTHHRPL